MGVDVSHLVFVPLGHTDDEVFDDGLDCSESRDILARAVVNLDGDFFLRRKREADCKM